MPTKTLKSKKRKYYKYTKMYINSLSPRCDFFGGNAGLPFSKLYKSFFLNNINMIPGDPTGSPDVFEKEGSKIRLCCIDKNGRNIDLY